MNPLTLIRDLVYQRRFTESLRLTLFCRHIGLPYIKTHSGKLNPSRKSIWLGNGSGDNYGWSLGDGYGWGNGNGWGMGCGYGHGSGNGYHSSSSHRTCKWKKCK